MSEVVAQAIRAATSVLSPFWLDPPVLQPAALYLELLGEDLRARAYLLAGDVEDGLCLRPDMTAPAVKLALATCDWKAPFAVAYDGVVFRRQHDHKRETEFRQIGAERFGPAEHADEAAILGIALSACRAAGVTPRVRLGDVALSAIADAVSLEAAPDVAFATLSEIAARVAAPAGFKAAIDAAAARWASAPRHGVTDVTFSVGFGRGLAYYDGFVFELESPALGERASLGGGGRYDGLLRRIAASEGGGPQDAAAWGALGFALRPQRVADAAA